MVRSGLVGIIGELGVESAGIEVGEDGIWGCMVLVVVVMGCGEGRGDDEGAAVDDILLLSWYWFVFDDDFSI